MDRPFFITGLPRSRTAWWAVAASTEVSTCCHEPLKYTSSFEDLLKYWSGSLHPFVGISESGLYRQLGRIMSEVAPRTLVIRRSRHEVFDSLARYLGADLNAVGIAAALEEADAALDAVADNPLVKTVWFDDMKSTGRVRACFDWLMPGYSHHFNEDLMTMNIQADREFVLGEAAKPHNKWYLE